MVLFLECGHVFTCGYSEGLTHTVPSSAHLQEQPNIIGQHSNNNTSHSPTVKTGLHYCLAGTPEGKFFPLSHLPKCLFLPLPFPSSFLSSFSLSLSLSSSLSSLSLSLSSSLSSLSSGHYCMSIISSLQLKVLHNRFLINNIMFY